ncbi:hypothetical protein [Demequina subtropica]|uniref:hypothetical protein n=1 Tax=Demequina subtropica TaxID=1638989 RepID=UPI0007859CA9|nr:hypothetical protein [Demequina subtropica]
MDHRARFALADLCIAASALFGYVIVVFRDSLVPAHYSFDAGTIQRLGRSGLEVFGDASYGRVATIYRTLGVIDDRLFVGLVQYTAFLLTVGLVYLRYRDRSRPPSLVVGPVGALALIFGAVYMGTFSKDVFVLPVVLVALTVRATVPGRLLAASAMIVYGAMFREYWFLVAALYFVFGLESFIRANWRRKLVVTAISVVVVSVVFGIYYGVAPDSLRATANAGRLDLGHAESAITSYVGGPEPFAGAVNNLLAFLFLLIPLPLILKGSIHYLLVGPLLAALWCRALVLQGATSAPRVTDGAGREPDQVRHSMAVLFAFVVVQSLFEPDYGSAVRHLTPLLPLALVLLLQTRRVESPPRPRSHLLTRKGVAVNAQR